MLVSTIIPAYNAAAFVREAVDSALAQEGVEQEIIVVNDGSTDATPQILAEYGDRIRVITQENRGVAASRNAGAAVARGEWLAFLDSDDIWRPRKLARQLATAEDQTQLVFALRENFGQPERVALFLPNPPDELVVNTFQVLLIDNWVTTSTVILRRASFERVGGFEVSRDLMGCEDWDLWLRLAAKGERFAFVSEPLVRYRWHGGGITSRFAQVHRARLLVFQRALNLGPVVEPSTQRKAMANLWATSAWVAEPASRWTAAWWYLRAVSYEPARLGLYKSALRCVVGRI